MNEKITWDDVYKDFKTRHPRLSKDVCDYRPYAYLQIQIWFKNDRKMIYDYMTHRGSWVE